MRYPPTGTVTFLFTDIEGSTMLWEQHPEAMRPALARHDDLLRQSIENNGGFVFKTAGDSFCTAFDTAPEALAGALAAHLALSTEPWEAGVPLRVRLALHTGSAEERDGDYFGPTLNRTARLLAAAHGGQILVSAATQELVRDHLPSDATLRDLGEASLKDLARPERVFQLLHPALASDFPPLRSLDNPALPNNLPQQLTSFIGREKELGEIRALLAGTRLLTLTGAGGSGKTRLSLQVAADLLDQYEGGVWLVKLAPLTDPSLVPQTVADVLGVREEAGKPSMGTLVDWLRPKRLLLVLDNCEHLIGACAALATDLLRSCPGVYLLASSREPLTVAGEQTYRVPSLTLPDPKKNLTAAALSQYEAVSLFIERARAVRADFTVTDANAPAVAQVCFRLDGIPLAIELAAVRVRSLSVEDINARLDNRFRLLTGGARDMLPRQQTLRALIDWSYDLLTDQEKTLLRRLSVFAGGWTLAAAEAVGLGEDATGSAIEDWEVLDLLASLVDKSLVVYEEGADGGRYRLLETIRHYSRERLGEAGEEEETRQRHLGFFLAFAEEAEPQLLDEHQRDCVRRLQAEADNLRAALTQSHGDTQVALRLAGALRTYWDFTNSVREGRVHLAAALSLPGAKERTSARAKALIGAAGMVQRSNVVEAQACLEESLSITREVGDEMLTVWALLGIGDAASNRGSYRTAHDLLAEGLALCQVRGYWPGLLWALNYQGVNSLRQGQAAEARECWEHVVALARGGHWDGRICWTLNNLASLARDESRQGAALALAQESLALVRAAGIKTDFSWTAEIAADLHLDQGEFEEARGLLREVEEFRKAEGWERSSRTPILMARACLGLGEYDTAQAYLGLSAAVSNEQEFLDAWRQQYQGDVALGRQDKAKACVFYRNSLRLFRGIQDIAGTFLALSGLSATEEGERSARLHGAAQVLGRTDDRVSRILKPHERQLRLYEQAVAASRAALGEASFTAAYDAGRAMTAEQAMEYVLADG